jgi:serine/threonine protein kinase
MLIDINGHIKLTDFGLSKSGFIGRRAIGVGDIGVSKTHTPSGPPLSPLPPPEGTTTGTGTHAFPFPGISPFRNVLSRRGSVASISSNDSLAGLGSRMTEKLEDRNPKKLVGTPDYLAPESILGLGQGVSVDWVRFHLLIRLVGCWSHSL